MVALGREARTASLRVRRSNTCPAARIFRLREPMERGWPCTNLGSGIEERMRGVNEVDHAGTDHKALSFAVDEEAGVLVDADTESLGVLGHDGGEARKAATSAEVGVDNKVFACPARGRATSAPCLCEALHCLRRPRSWAYPWRWLPRWCPQPRRRCDRPRGWLLRRECGRGSG